MAIYSSGWQLLLVSLIPTYLQVRRCSVITILFFSLTTDMNPFSLNPRVPAAQPGVRHNTNIAGVRVHYFLLLAVFQSPFVSSQWLL